MLTKRKKNAARTGGRNRVSGGRRLCVEALEERLALTWVGVPPTTTNVAFGDADRKTLYIAARTHLYRIRLNVAGPRPVQPR